MNVNKLRQRYRNRLALLSIVAFIFDLLDSKSVLDRVRQSHPLRTCTKFGVRSGDWYSRFGLIAQENIVIIYIIATCR